MECASLHYLMITYDGFI
ncbi:uncharacterized protein FFNC_15713 [Fusarium fujikuroi]|nr:uncharacterized protein FFNC_15713 [Fusarium fujikuroi]